MMNQTTTLRYQPLLAKLTALICLCAMAVLNPAADAQTATEILDMSRDALLETPGFQAQFRMKGEGGSMFADTMPSMNGQLFFGTSDEFGRVIRTMGEAKDKQTDPSKPLDQLITEDRYIWVDRQAQTITQAPNKAKSRGVPTSLELVLVSPIINGDPYGSITNGAESINLDAQEEVAGELCDKIVIKYPKATARNRSSARSYTEAIWWISEKDKLPRRVQHITDAGMVKITLDFALSNLRVTETNQKQLDVTRPPNFEFVSKMPRTPTPQEVQNEPETTSEPITQPKNTPPSPEANANPEPTDRPVTYAFTTSEGDSVDNTTQQGRVTVLYFMGSWCVPCVETSALLETMRNNLDGADVDVFALGIREGDPDRAQRTFSSDYPNIPISLNPENITSDFEIRIYPTIVVLDREGMKVFRKAIGKNFGPDKLVEEVTTAAREALTDA